MRCFGLGHTASVCKKEQGSWEQYKLFLKNKFGMGPEFVGKTKDNMTKYSPDLSTKAVEEPAKILLLEPEIKRITDQMAEKKSTRVSTRKRIPTAKLRT